MSEHNTGIIVLAAGASSRLGRPKQLLPYLGTTLLQHTLQVATGAATGKVIVILGANAAEIEKEIMEQNVQVAINNYWQEGMGSSIRFGLTQLLNVRPEVDAAIIMLCDQPHVTTGLLNDLVAARMHTQKKIIASSYSSIIGVPAIFDASLFPELLLLKGDVGAKNIIQRHSGGLGVISFEKGIVDIDTAADYEKLEV
ncbi:MAG: nucleotidyltransferase family protein [Bacteroidota bacterium]